MHEFDVIEKLFSPLAEGCPGAFGLRDDGAVLSVPEGQEIVIVSDTLNEGVHFFPDDPPDLIARKALRVNLSDLAAMGAKPWVYQLTLALPDRWDTRWLTAFAKGLSEDQERYGVCLSGGDTTSVQGKGSVSVTALGLVPAGTAVRRSGAQAGDDLYMTGPIGDAYLGLKCLDGTFEDVQDRNVFIGCYHLPQPRTDLSGVLRDYAHAAMDISDGLVADLGHLCRASGVSAVCHLGDIPFSDAARLLIRDGHVTEEDLLTGGDDYELLVSVSPAHQDMFLAAAHDKNIHPVRIGGIVEPGEAPVQILGDGRTPLCFQKGGWRHL